MHGALHKIDTFQAGYRHNHARMQIGSSPRCFALVPCAGVGQRAGVAGPKQYHPLAGRALVAHTLAALAQVGRLSATLVVLSPDDRQFEQAAPQHRGEQAWVARCGGATRAETVANGLQALIERGAQPHDWVLVHDAARCLITPACVDRLIDACQDDEVGGLLALPLADTLKQEQPHSVRSHDPSGAYAPPLSSPLSAESSSNHDNQLTTESRTAVVSRSRVAMTIERSGKWAAQTPQMFRLGLLLPALRHAGDAVTDESSAIEALGHAPLLVRGDLTNLKVTWPEDFSLAERLLAHAG